MTIYDFPANIGMTNVTISAENAIGEGVSPLNFRGRQALDFGGQRWRILVDFCPEDRAQAAIVESFLKRLQGRANGFRLGDPYCSLPVGGPIGDGTVTSATQGDNIVTASGVTGIAANDYIQIGDHLYSVLNVDGNDLEVWPRLRSSYAGSTPIITDNPRGVWALVDNVTNFHRAISTEKFIPDRIEAVEVIL